MSFIAVIFARGGSKGLKNKNLLKINNISLLGHSIIQAKKIKIFKKIIVSTDNKKIAKEALRYGAEVPFLRPKKLSNSGSPEILAWRHAIKFINENLGLYPEYLVSLPTTSPLRSIKDVKKAMEKAKKKKLDIVFSITESSKNPYFNMVKIHKGKLQIICNKKNKFVQNRQSAPQCYDLTTVCYVFKPKYVMNNTNLFSGKISYVKVNKVSAIDIDDRVDFDIAKKILEDKN